jgi:hypothetical protein
MLMWILILVFAETRDGADNGRTKGCPRIVVKFSPTQGAKSLNLSNNRQVIVQYVVIRRCVDIGWVV